MRILGKSGLLSYTEKLRLRRENKDPVVAYHHKRNKGNKLKPGQAQIFCLGHALRRITQEQLEQIRKMLPPDGYDTDSIDDAINQIYAIVSPNATNKNRGQEEGKTSNSHI